MGAIFSSLWTLLQGEKPYKLSIAGLDGVGKTTLLYKLKLGEVVQTIPTIGFNVEVVQHRNITFEAWDLPSQDKIRPLWRHYIQGHPGLIYVVDSVDKTRLEESRTELDRLLSFPEAEDCPILVLANKQDLSSAMTPSEIIEAFKMETLKRPWAVKGVSAVTSEGVEDALDWMAKELMAK